MHTILQAGLPKSGNYWLWTMIQAAFKATDAQTRSYVTTHPIRPLTSTWTLTFSEQPDVDMIRVDPDADWMIVLPRYKEKINNLDDYIQRVSHVWTHSPVWNQRAATTMASFQKRVYIIRDLRSVIVSRAYYDVTPYKLNEFSDPPGTFEASLQRAVEREPARWYEHLTSWLDFSLKHDVLFIRYEDFRLNLSTTCELLLEYIGIAQPDIVAKSLSQQLSIDSMRGLAPRHVRSGTVDEWQSLLVPEHFRNITPNIIKLMDRFGYNSTKEDDLSSTQTE